MKLIQPYFFAGGGCTADCGAGWADRDGDSYWTTVPGFNTALSYSWHYTSSYQYANYFATGHVFVLGAGMDLCTDDSSRITWTVTDNGLATDLSIIGPDANSVSIADGFFVSVDYSSGLGELRPYTASIITFQAKLDGVDICSPIVLSELDTINSP